MATLGPDSRFFLEAGPAPLSELARAAGAELLAGAADIEIDRVAPLVHADGRSVAFFSDRRYLADLKSTAAAAVFVDARFAEHAPAGCIALVTRFPQAGWALAAGRLHPQRRLTAGASVHPDAELEDGVELAPGVVIGAGARIGRGAVIGANTVIEPGVAIGRDCRIGSNVSIACALIGDRVNIASGAVIGAAGFGVAPSAKGALDVPQLGRVILQDGVSVGANSCIDRGAYADTVIGESTKIDNLVQIGHNCRLGRNCLVAAHVGLSGSVTVGDGVMFGGQAGVADHVTLGDGSALAGGAGTLKDIPAGETWSGYPAKPIRRWLRESAWLSKQAAGRHRSDD
jgi:UDP-3-O-[3-hydroxymyristoyl] glucosamine N-acyltransferase